jgi:F0F1-type ATP synthase alpha subunit
LERSSNVFLQHTGSGFVHASAEENTIANDADKTDRFITASITALPIVQTKESDFSAYVPTNIVSITDGQIYLDPALMNNDVFPAIHVGLSVSRLGGDAQNGIMKALTKSIKGDLASYNDKMKYSTYGLELDEIGKRIIRHGSRLITFFKQTLLHTSSEFDTAKEISNIYLMRFLEEYYESSNSQQDIRNIETHLKRPLAIKEGDSPKEYIMNKYFGMTKFGMKKTKDNAPSDVVVELKDGSYLIQSAFIDFFRIEGEPSNMTIETLYDGFISCLKK